MQTRETFGCRNPECGNIDPCRFSLDRDHNPNAQTSVMELFICDECGQPLPYTFSEALQLIGHTDTNQQASSLVANTQRYGYTYQRMVHLTERLRQFNDSCKHVIIDADVCVILDFAKKLEEKNAVFKRHRKELTLNKRDIRTLLRFVSNFIL